MDTELTGITSASFHMGGTDWLKKELLLHGKIGMYGLDGAKTMLRSYSSVKAHRADVYEYLQDRGVVFEPSLPSNDASDDVGLWLKQASLARDAFEYEHPSDVGEYRKRQLEGRLPAKNSFDHNYNMQAFLVKSMCCDLRDRASISAIPMLYPKFYYQNGLGLKRVSVAKVLINCFPAIGADVPFEDLLSLRDEPEMVRARSALRSWMRGFDVNELTEAEIRDEILHVKDEYIRYLNSQKIKYELGFVESLVKLGSGLVEDTLKLNLKSLSETLFSITKENVALSEAELVAPGKELAYLAKLDESL